MPPASAKPPAQRKRNRKRKRRAASSSSSSASSSSSDSSEDENAKPAKIIPVSKPLPLSASSSSESSSSDSSSSDEEDIASARPQGKQAQRTALKTVRALSRSPSPPPTAIPSFLPSEAAGNDSASQEQQLKDRFRQFWMSSMADGFKDDLEEIRKEPNLGPSRLALLVDSLAAGADVFTSSSKNNTTMINEMDVVLN